VGIVVDGQSVEVLVDSGASDNIIDKGTFRSFASPVL
jgi:predicted aspartyl protease